MYLLDVVYRDKLIRDPNLYDFICTRYKVPMDFNNYNIYKWDILNKFYFEGKTPWLLPKVFKFGTPKVFNRFLMFFFDNIWLDKRLLELRHINLGNSTKKKLEIYGNPWEYKDNDKEWNDRVLENHRRSSKESKSAKIRLYGTVAPKWKYNGDIDHDKTVYELHHKRTQRLIEEGRHPWFYSGDKEHDNKVHRWRVRSGRNGFINARNKMIANGYDGLLHSDGENYIINKLKEYGFNINVNKIIKNTVSNNSGSYFPDGFIEEYNLIIECDGFSFKKNPDGSYKDYWRQKYIDYNKMNYNVLIFQSDTLDIAKNEVDDMKFIKEYINSYS